MGLIFVFSVCIAVGLIGSACLVYQMHKERKESKPSTK